MRILSRWRHTSTGVDTFRCGHPGCKDWHVVWYRQDPKTKEKAGPAFTFATDRHSFSHPMEGMVRAWALEASDSGKVPLAARKHAEQYQSGELRIRRLD